MGWATGFGAGVLAGRGLVDTYRDSEREQKRSDIEAALGKIADAKPEQAAVPAPEATDPTDITTPSVGQSFLGKSYAAPLDDAGMERARQLAQAGVFERHGEVERGGRMRDRVTQADIAAEGLAQRRKQGEREDKLFPVQLEGAHLALDNARSEGSRRKAKDTADKAISNDWKARLTNPDGSPRAATDDDHLWMARTRAARLAEAGDPEASNAALQQSYGLMAAKIAKETAERTDAARRASAGIAAGNFEGVIQLYNQFIPDGAHVTGMKRGPKGEIMVEREMDGKKLPPHTYGSVDELRVAVESVADPARAWQMSQELFRNNLDMRRTAASEKQANASIAASAASVRASNAQTVRVEGEEKDRTDMRTIRSSLVEALDKGDREGEAKARKQLMAYATGGRNLGANATPEEKRAVFYLASGLAKTEAQAAELAHQKVQPSPQEVYLKLVMPQGGLTPRAEDVDSAMQTMYGPDWKQAVGPRPAAAPAAPSPRMSSGTVTMGAPVPKDVAGAHAEARAAVARGAPLASVNQRLQAAGLPPLQ